MKAQKHKGTNNKGFDPAYCRNWCSRLSCYKCNLEFQYRKYLVELRAKTPKQDNTTFTMAISQLTKENKHK